MIDKFKECYILNKEREQGAKSKEQNIFLPFALRSTLSFSVSLQCLKYFYEDTVNVLKEKRMTARISKSFFLFVTTAAVITF